MEMFALQAVMINNIKIILNSQKLFYFFQVNVTFIRNCGALFKKFWWCFNKSIETLKIFYLIVQLLEKNSEFW